MKTLSTTTPYDIKTLVTEAVIEGQLRITYADETAYLDALVAAAWKHVEDYVSESYGATTLTFESSAVTANFELPVFADRLSSVTVQYWDGSAYNTASTVYNSTIGYPTCINVDADDAALKAADADNAIILTKGTAVVAEKTPETAVQMAFLMLLMHFYQNREAVTLAGKPEEMPMGVKALLTPYKKGILK